MALRRPVATEEAQTTVVQGEELAIEVVTEVAIVQLEQPILALLLVKESLFANLHSAD